MHSTSLTYDSIQTAKPQGMMKYSSKLESAFDIQTFWGRVKHFNMMMNPRNFFHGKETLLDYAKNLKEYENMGSLGNQKVYSNEELWRMKYCVISNIHPQTNEVIPYPFRTSAFVLSNTPLSFALACLPPTPFNQILSQSANQTFNFCFNYFNRNVSNVYNNTELAISFTGAVTASIVGSLGTAALSKKITYKPLQSIMYSISPYIGVSVASVCNLAFSRFQDFSKGIEVFDIESGESLGSNSLIAAKMAFWQTALSRVVIPIPVFLIPIGGINYLMKTGRFPKGAAAGNALKIGLSVLGLWIGGTVGFSLFEQNTKCHISKLESKFQNLLNKNGKKIENVTFNKGL